MFVDIGLKFYAVPSWSTLGDREVKVTDLEIFFTLGDLEVKVMDLEILC